jgi:hypothetical protein
LGISVAGQAELEPRVPLVSSPYCFTARTVEDEAITAEKIANFTINGEKIANGHVVRTLNGLSDEINLLEGDNVTITPEDNNLIISATGGGGGISGSGTAGQVASWDGTSSLTGDDWLYWDSANRRLGIGTTSPEQLLHVNGLARFDLGGGQVNLSTPGGWPGLIAFAPGGDRRDIVFDNDRMYLAASSSAAAPSGTNGITLLENGRIGIGTINPNARLRVESNEHMTATFASTFQSDTTEVLRANYLGGGNVEATAIKGISRPADGFGVGGDFTGGQYGLKATGNGGDTGRYIWGLEANASGSTTNMSYRYGIWSQAWGPSIGNNLGVVGYAYGEGNASIGVYGWGSGDNKLVWGVYGDVDGYGSGLDEASYAVYGETAGAGDSVYAGYFDGNLVYTGGLYKPSDESLKSNLQPVGGAIEKILALEPKKYTYERTSHAGMALPSGEHYGLVAQEVEKILPELVGDLYHPAKPALRGDNPEIGESFGYKGIDYIELIPILVQAIKEQQETIDELKAEVELLKRR